jgi:homoaconitase/3-isopropylmalate dehydratase large subunit
MKKVPYVFSIAVSLLIVAAAPEPTVAQTTSASSTPATNISNEYSYFLKNVNSQQVVNDLRNGQWTTTVTDPKTNLTTTTTEAVPTGKMGFGNVKISLALAQESLRQQGILQPTSEQLHTALVGGQMVPGDSTTMTNGILQMRADGMGWGQIAQKYDVKLGQLMSGKQPASTTTTSTTSTSTTSKGITTANGKSSTTVTGKGNGKAFSGSESQESGIVSASGRTSGTSSGSVSHGGRGIVSGSGRSLGHTSGIVTGAGSGHQYGASGGGHGNGGGNGKGPK